MSNPNDDPDYGFTSEQIAEFEKAEDRVDTWLQSEGLEIAREAFIKARTRSQVQCADCQRWIDRDSNHMCTSQIKRNRQHGEQQ